MYFERRIRAKKLGDYFTPNTDNPLLYYHKPDIDFTIRNRHLFNRASFIILVLFTLFALSFKTWLASTLLLALVCFLFGLYLYARAAAQGLFVSRDCVSHAFEHETIDVTLVIRNASGFAIQDIQILDQFSGSSETLYPIWIQAPIPSRRILRHTYKVICDGGMGEHYFGPLEIIVNDPLGIFEFYVTESRINTIDVLPERMELPEVEFPESLNSRTYGPVEGSKIGSSSNFFGVREYRPGDPIKQISWRLTARSGIPIIKEMEESVATELTILLDLDASRQIGIKEKSTWEYSKDIVISLLRQQLGATRRVQLLTQQAQIPFGIGASHIADAIEQIRNLMPCSEETMPNRWIRVVDEFIPYGSTVLFVGPIFRTFSDELCADLASLREMGVNLVCIFLDGSSFLEQELFPGTNSMVRQSQKETRQNLDHVLQFAGQLDIPSYVVPYDHPIEESLRRPVVE